MNPTQIVTHVPVYVLAMEMVTRQVQTCTICNAQTIYFYAKSFNYGVNYFLIVYSKGYAGVIGANYC